MALTKGTNCGFVATAPTGDPDGNDFDQIDNRTSALKDTSSVGTTKITEIGFYVNNATDAGNCDVGIYTHDSGNNDPDSLVGSSGEFAKGTSAGWKVATGLNISVSESTTYWIAANLDNTTTRTDIDWQSGSTGNVVCRDFSTDILNDPFDTNSTSNNFLCAIYAVELAETGTNMQVNVSDSWKEISAMKINIGDVWKDIEAAQINIGDTWKNIF